ncbi:zinc metalloprotease HtpX [Candidatus Wolfebacteria bacterium]|nr:MAG: zinc metalloprotease HtpX [Candidatus Wolfebacteria bacterium]
MSSFFVLIIVLGWSFSYIYQNTLILYFAVFFSLFMNIISYWHSDKIVLKMSGAKQITRDQYFDLWNAVENLSISSGLKMPRVFVIEDKAPNAFATGRDEEHAAVAVTTGLLGILDKSELEGVIAHELAHIKNRDILLMTVVVVLVGSVTLLSDFFLRMTFWGGGRSDNRDGRMQMILMIVGIVLAILAPIIAMIIKLAISRKREFLADASGALMTRYPEGLASALEKISGYHGDMKRANHATAHLYISSPFNSNKSSHGFMTKLFLTHPPVEERLHALRHH